VAAGNDSGETEFLIVEDASSLIAAGFGTGTWAIAELGFDAFVVSINNNTLELSFPIVLAQFGLVQGATVTVASYV
jgi:hypothetical protein